MASEPPSRQFLLQGAEVSVIDDVVQANEKYYQTFTGGNKPVQPKKKLAILTCMDSRIDVFDILGLESGDAHVIRNAGGIVTDDALRSLIVSQNLLGTEEILVMNHTDCGLMLIGEDEMKEKLQRQYGTAAVSPSHFHAFKDLEQNVRDQVQKLRTHPWLPNAVPVRGFIYDVRTGRLTEVRVS
jgi:carbonic anhydrase